MAPFLLQEAVVNACEKFIEWSGFLAEVFYELVVIVAVIGTVYPNIPLSSAYHCDVFLSYRVTPKVP